MPHQQFGLLHVPAGFGLIKALDGDDELVNGEPFPAWHRDRLAHVRVPGEHLQEAR